MKGYFLTYISIFNCRALYSNIYNFSNSKSGPLTYTLSEAANKRYKAFIDVIAASLNSQWQKNACPEDGHILHVVCDQLMKMLHGADEASPPGGEVGLITLEESIALCNYFTDQRRIFDQVSVLIAN